MILNQQRRIRVSIAALNRFLSAAQRRLHLSPDSLTVALVTDAQMTRWNQAYRGKNRPTDVLSFPDDGPRPYTAARGIRNGQPLRHAWRTAKRKRAACSPSSASYLGDIAIAPAIARRNARRLGRSFHDEMRILILHGMLHLLGYDHDADSGQMDHRERELRRGLGLA